METQKLEKKEGGIFEERFQTKLELRKQNLKKWQKNHLVMVKILVHIITSTLVPLIHLRKN